jgi:hypothetical protein
MAEFPGLSSAAVVVTERMLTLAARAGDLESLTTWARQGVRVATARPLILAIRGGHLKAAQFLVQKLGADVNQATRNGPTLLMVATQRGNLAMLQCRVQKLGADVNQATRNGLTPLAVAVAQPCTTIWL